jgi:RHS repeat-associated protein
MLPTGGVLSFKYDPFGRRIQKTNASGPTAYVYDGDNIIEELTGSTGTIGERYTYGPGIDEPLVGQRQPLIFYYEADGLGSVTSLTDPTGAPAATYTYDSFGFMTASTGSATNWFRYAARQFDSDTALYYYRARYYDPTTGRFLGEDPVRFRAGANFYDYVHNNPSNFKDPSGQAGCKPDCSSLSLDNPNTFWDDTFATPEQVDSFFEASNGPGSWDGYDAAQAFINAGINPGLAVGIIGAETSFGNGSLSQNNINNPFSTFPKGKPATSFSQSLALAVGAVTRIQNTTTTDSAPVTALIDQQNTLNRAYEGDSMNIRTQWRDNVNSWYRKLANFLGLCQ